MLRLIKRPDCKILKKTKENILKINQEECSSNTPTKNGNTVKYICIKGLIVNEGIADNLFF
ncbi:hypothetical protein EGLA_00900 [Enterococcus gallinarum]|nr:hypothetical protein AH4_31670 [Enterococcus gallinarum]